MKSKKERLKEISRLREMLKHGKWTVKEIAQIRGRIGGLSGADHPAKREAGLKGSAIRWKNHKPKTKTKKSK
jgi:hypothetical protein